MVEKLLTNWMSICLYTFVRVREAEVDGAVLWGGAGLRSPHGPQHPPLHSLPTPVQHVLRHLKLSAPASCPGRGGVSCTPLPHASHLSQGPN